MSIICGPKTDKLRCKLVNFTILLLIVFGEDAGDAGWETKATPNANSSWGNWGKAKELHEDQAGSSNDGGNNWDNKANLENQNVVSSVVTENQTGSWSTSNAGSWGKGKNVVGESSLGWNQQKSLDKGKGVIGSDEPSCGNNVTEEASWGNSGSKAPGIQAGGWGYNAGGSSTQQVAEDADQDSVWSKAKGETGGHGGKWGSMKNPEEGSSGWKKDGDNQTDDWNKPKAFGNEGVSVWNKKVDINANDEAKWKGLKDSSDKPKTFGGSWTKGEDDIKEQGGWERPRTFDGSGGRRGGRTVGRDQYGRGRSFDEENNWNSDQSAGWGKSKRFAEDRTDEGQLQGSSGWGNKSSDWSNKKSPCWNQSAQNEKDGTGGKDQGENSGGGSAPRWGQSGGWNSETSKATHKSGCWNQTSAEIEKEGEGSKDKEESSWNVKKGSDEGSASKWGQSSSGSWRIGTNNMAGHQENKWGNKSNWNQSRSSSWNEKSADNEKAGEGSKDQGENGWNSKRTSDGGSVSKWGQSSGSWKSNWNPENAVSDQSEAGENDYVGSRGRGGFNRGFGGRGGFNRGGRSGGWSNKNDCNEDNSGEGGGFGGGSGFNRGGFGGRGGGRSGGWGNNNDSGEDNSGEVGGFGSGRGGYNRGGRYGGRGGGRNGWSNRNESGDDSNSNEGGYGGSGGFKRGGFGGRGGGWNNRNDSGEDKTSEGGGFRGRDRGGFGGRGRGRREYSGGGGWNNRNDSAEERSTDWKSNSSSDKSQWQSWGGGGGGGADSTKGTTGGMSSGWSSQGSGSWNKPEGSKGTGDGSGSQTGGSWNKETDDKGKWQSWNVGSSSTKEHGGTSCQVSDWASSQASGSWNKGNDDKGKYFSGWDKSTVAKGDGGTDDQASGWSKGTQGGTQSSGWIKSSDAKEGNTGGGEPAASSWGSAGASSWGKGSNESSKGRW